MANIFPELGQPCSFSCLFATYIHTYVCTVIHDNMKTRQGKPAAENTFIIFQRASCSCGSDPFCAHQSIKQASNHRPPASQAHGKRVVIASSDKRVNQSEVGNFNNTGRFQPACLWSLVCLQPQGSALPPTIALEQGRRSSLSGLDCIVPGILEG